MSTEQQKEVREFFDRPADQVAKDFSRRYMWHEARSEIFEGAGGILGLETDSGVRYFSVEQVVLYSDEYTRERWRYSRAPEIAQMEAGEVIGYIFRGNRILTFIKTQGAENIMLDQLREVDRFGTPLMIGDEGLTKPTQIAPMIGLGHRMYAQFAPFNFRGQRALLLSAGERIPSEEELARIEKELLMDEDEL